MFVYYFRKFTYTSFHLRMYKHMFCLQNMAFLWNMALFVEQHGLYVYQHGLCGLLYINFV